MKKSVGRKGKLLSAGDRDILINAWLNNIPLNMLSFLEIPFSQLEIVCLPKNCGGLGFLDLKQ